MSLLSEAVTPPIPLPIQSPEPPEPPEPPATALSHLTAFITEHGYSPAVVVLDDYFSLEDYVAVHGGEVDGNRRHDRKQLLNHRKQVQTDLGEFMQNGTHAAVVPIDATEFNGWLLGVNSKGLEYAPVSQLVRQYVNEIAAGSNGSGVMHQSPYPTPRFAIAAHPEKTLDNLVGPGEHTDEYFLIHLRAPFQLIEVRPSALLNLISNAAASVTPWPLQYRNEETDELIAQMAAAALAFTEHASPSLKASADYTINYDPTFTPPQYLMFENFAVDVPVRFVLDTVNGVLGRSRLDAPDLVQITWIKAPPDTREARLSTVRELAAFLRNQVAA